VYPATESPNLIGPEDLLPGRTSVDRARMHMRRNCENVLGDCGWLVEM
jgi:hypothetical protein